MSSLSKRTVSKEELEKLRLAWQGKEAQAKEAVIPSFSPNYMVLVSCVRNSKRGRYLKNDTFLFNSEEAAKACYAYYAARGGVNTLAMVYVMYEWGWGVDPADEEYYA